MSNCKIFHKKSRTIISKKWRKLKVKIDKKVQVERIKTWRKLKTTRNNKIRDEGMGIRIRKMKLKSKVKKTQVERISWKLERKLRNRLVKSRNGNGGIKTSVKMVNWNLGPRRWVNKLEDLEHMTLDHRPDIAIISEANLWHTTEDYEAHIPGYKLIKTKDFQLGYCSRLVVMIREGLDHQILDNSMEPDIASIWIKLSSRGTKPIIIGAVYREHHLLGRSEPTDHETQQTFRWNRFLTQWNKLEGKGEIIIAGDTNLDKLKWSQPESRNEKMVTAMKDKIETKGYSQIGHWTH